MKHFFVVKAGDLLALNYLPVEHQSPVGVEWINRGNDRKLSPSTLEQLLRTFHLQDASPSIVALRESSGLRVMFETEGQRAAFAREFEEARRMEKAEREHTVTAIFPDLGAAETAAKELFALEVPEAAISFLWRSNQFTEPFPARAGHTRSRVLANVTSGGIAGAALGVAILVIPGVGPVAAAGAVLASAYSAVATASGIIGATGAAMATMLSDMDVDGMATNHQEQQLKRGRVFLAVDRRKTEVAEQKIVRVLEQNCGRCVV
ncbi:hypothetical protein [Aurantiacibacter hainanensis]|uniref:hypothetical protein n=1 Tax=Aurantiacibacter hainanensis TaxID=3076114 RepID=UPI0030C6DE95